MYPRRLLPILTVVACLVFSAPALANQPHAFTPQAPSYSEKGRYGQLHAQINYSRQRLQWSWQLYSSTCRIATGLMLETASIYQDGRQVKTYHDHHLVPACYLVHSSYGPVTTRHTYRLVINEEFPIEKNGKQGVRFIYARFDFVVTLV